MENFLRDKDILILGSVCLVATFLWQRWWKLFSIKKRGKTKLSADKQVIQQGNLDEKQNGCTQLSCCELWQRPTSAGLHEPEVMPVISLSPELMLS